MVKIIPAILSADPKEVETLLARTEGTCERVQIDIIDGVFAENKTIDPSVLENSETELFLDFHLMTKEPVLWVERAVRAGADRIIGQVEKMQSQIDFVAKMAEVGLSVGLALDLETPVSQLDVTILNNLDVVLVMAVKAGLGGQPFDERVLNKIKRLDDIRKKDASPYKVCVDGGLTVEAAQKAASAGADEFAIGRRIFAGDLKANVEKYQQAIEKINGKN